MSAVGARPAGPAYATAAGPAAATLRAAGFGGLCAFALLTWSRLVAPGWTAGALATSICATVVVGGALARPGRGRAGRLLPAAALVAAGLLLAGVPARLLLPDRWGELASGIGDGAGTLSSLTVPYAGDDAWARRTLLLAGIAFVVVAAVTAARARALGSAAPVTAVIALLALYTIAVIQLQPAHPGLSGAACTLLLALALWADRVPRGLGATATGLVMAACLAGMLAVPLLDRPGPAIDVQRLTSDATASRTATYRWDHDYGPLNWPRRGREVLRVRTTTPSYWKAEVLDGFDGRAWRQAGGVASFEPSSDRRTLTSGWTRRIAVTVRDLRIAQFVGAGETLGIQRSVLPAVAQAGGFFVSDQRELRRGDTYTATVYTPRPSPRQLARAGADYPSFARLWLRVDLPDAPVRRTVADAGVPVEAQFAPFGRRDTTLISFRGGGSGLIETDDPDAIVRGSGLGRIFGLAQRLRRSTRTPYAFLQAVQARVRRGATYDERPPVSAAPLDTFLFRVRRGYCQHFSGAMALLLRMGGVPARVATGFSPGTYDRAHRRYVVTDLDAHSWVEAYFPRLGWITFDPTPAAAPARDQLADLATGGRVTPRVGRNGARDLPADAPGRGRAAASDGAGTRRAVLLLGLLALAAGAWFAATRRRRPRAPAPDPELAELERALRRTGRVPAPPDTLADLRHTLGDCGGYLDALTRRRFGPAGSPAPTPRQRRDLRRALGAGLGPAGAARALWGLPPLLFRRRPPGTGRRVL